MLGQRRVVITSVGLVSAAGLDVDEFWAGLLEPDRDPSLGLPERFDPLSHFENAKEARRMERFVHMTVAAADELFARAGEIDVDPRRFGAIVWASGGFESLTEQSRVYKEKGSRRVSPFLIPTFTPNVAAAYLSMRHKLQGPVEAVPSACTSGISCIDHAARTVAEGRADVMIAGASENGMIPVSQAAYEATGGASEDRVCRPFDGERNGFVQSEGCALVLIEDLDRAVARGATIWAEILGIGQTIDAFHLVQPREDRVPATKAVRHALAEAGLSPSDIGLVCAHGSGTELNDLTEARIYADVFGTPGPAITAVKGATGHTAGAAATTEVITVLLAMQRGVIPPSTNHKLLDPNMPAIDVVAHGEPREWTPTYAMSNNFGFGGHNGSIVLGPPPT